MTDIANQRLLNQHIAGEKFEKPETVVRWMGALQAQDYQQALWAVGLRTQSATVADIEQAIADRKIVRTWPLRGTIHFVPPEDARWMLKLSASRMLAMDGRRQKQLELDEIILKRCEKLFFEALKGGKRLSRPDMMSLLENTGISTERQRGYHILWYLSQSGVICPGPMEGKQQTFVLLDEWVPDSRKLSREESLAELARRYFAGHGPATVHDFAWWSGLSVTEARAGLEAAQSGLFSHKIAGKEFWMAQDTSQRTGSEDSKVYLLPAFDEYLLGYKDRSAVLSPEQATKVVPGKNGMFFPIIVVAGQVIGTWKRSFKKKSIDISLNLFTPFDDAEARVVEAAQCYSDFVRLPLTAVEVSYTS